MPSTVNAAATAAALPAGEMSGWERTSRGGVRRTRVAQRQSAGQITRRPVTRNHPRVLIRLREELGLPECPYVIRWRLQLPWGSVRLHHWLGPDDGRAFHDHPWWFVTLVLRGGYTDRSPAGAEHLRAGSVRYRAALYRHTVIPDPGGAWTLLVTGPQVRAWGFWVRDRFVKANKWFFRYGHHPCDTPEFEDSPSGLGRTPGKRVGADPPREFESRILGVGDVARVA
jgi:hypothetical protein